MALNPNFHFHTIFHNFPTQTTKLRNRTFNLHIPKATSQDSNQPSNKNLKTNKKSDPTNKTLKEQKLSSQKSFKTKNPQKPIKDFEKNETSEIQDFIRNSLKETFDTIREQDSEFKDVGNVFKDQNDNLDDKSDGLGEGVDEGEKGGVVEEEDPDWPVDAEIGWGIRASEYFEKHPIKNVVGEDGVMIDWEGELDDTLVKEINCLEWESFAFHPSPLIVLVFERYNRASENWRALKELEKAAKVYWNAKDRLPPRTVKLDMNLETDLAYALKVRDCPQLLFLRGNRIIYRETQIRTADELVQMIAHFYYKARKPSWLKDAQLYT